MYFPEPCRHHQQPHAGRPRCWPGRLDSDGHLSRAAHHGFRFSLCCRPDWAKEHHVVVANGGGNNHHTDHHHHHNNHARARYLQTSCPWVDAVEVLCCGIRRCLMDVVVTQVMQILLEGTMAIYGKCIAIVSTHSDSRYNCVFITITLPFFFLLP